MSLSHIGIPEISYDNKTKYFSTCTWFNSQNMWSVVSHMVQTITVYGSCVAFLTYLGHKTHGKDNKTPYSTLGITEQGLTLTDGQKKE